MKTIKPIIDIGRIQDRKEFKEWLESQGYDVDTNPNTSCYVDGEDVSVDMQAAEIWQSLWDEFKGINRQ